MGVVSNWMFRLRYFVNTHAEIARLTAENEALRARLETVEAETRKRSEDA